MPQRVVNITAYDIALLFSKYSAAQNVRLRCVSHLSTVRCWVKEKHVLKSGVQRPTPGAMHGWHYVTWYMLCKCKWRCMVLQPSRPAPTGSRRRCSKGRGSHRLLCTAATTPPGHPRACTRSRTSCQPLPPRRLCAVASRTRRPAPSSRLTWRQATRSTSRSAPP